MSYKLPDGTEVDCTLVQARRVWEFCKTRRDVSCEVLGDAILIRSRDATDMALNKRAELITLDGQVFDRVLGWCNNPPPPMESEKPPEVSEFHRGVITAIETIWKRKFTTMHWTRETQDILARAAADGKVNGLATLLETIATTDMVEDVLGVLYRLRPAPDKPKYDKEVHAFCRGKVDTIQALWSKRFGQKLSDLDNEILLNAALTDYSNVDTITQLIAAGTNYGVVRKEFERLATLGKKG